MPKPKRGRTDAMTSEDLKTARANMLRALADEPNAHLKIGRCGAEHFPRLGRRYPSAFRICELLRGPRAMIDTLERELQRRVAVTHGPRVVNKNLGGGPSSSDLVHVAYVVLFRDPPKTPVVEKLRTLSIEPGRGLWAVLTPGTADRPCESDDDVNSIAVHSPSRACRTRREARAR